MNLSKTLSQVQQLTMKPQHVFIFQKLAQWSKQRTFGKIIWKINIEKSAKQFSQKVKSETNKKMMNTLK